MTVLETSRLRLRRLQLDDAPFILELLNDPGWLKYIGDKNVHSLSDAERYLREGPLDMYRRLGFGLYLVELNESAKAIGLCGLLRRAGLDDADLGFAFLPAGRAQGYAVEAATAVMSHARRDFGLDRVAAITSPENQASIGLLNKLGFGFERRMQLSSDSAAVMLFGCALGADVPAA